MSEQKTTVELVTKPLEEKTLENVRNLNGIIQDMVNAFGQAYLRKKELDEEHQLLEERLQTLEEDFKKANKDLRDALGELEKEYPRGQIDLREGTVTYRPDLKQFGSDVEVVDVPSQK
jgi:ABC-type phosphate transport system auxiliary subunit